MSIKNTLTSYKQIMKLKVSHCNSVHDINGEKQTNGHQEETDEIMSHPCVEHTAIINSAVVDLHTGNNLLLCY